MVNSDPLLPEILTACRFYLAIDDLGNNGSGGIDAYFMECKGFKRTQDVIEVCEVTPLNWGNAKFGHVTRTKIPGNSKTTNLVLKRGMTQSMTLWNWFAEVEEGKWKDNLRSGSLTVQNQSGEAQVRFEFKNAFPVSYVVADLSSSSNDIELEELEIAVETFQRTKPESNVPN